MKRGTASWLTAWGGSRVPVRGGFGQLAGQASYVLVRTAVANNLDKRRSWNSTPDWATPQRVLLSVPRPTRYRRSDEHMQV
jgi:hypothetical protein